MRYTFYYLIQLIKIMPFFRSCSQFNFKNANFIGVSLALIIVFLIYFYEFYIRQGTNFSIAWPIVTSFFYIMSLWSFILAAFTDPGRVPLFWALYNTNPQQRKFCLVCHNFKPQRCHHCSKCRQCVLNMDHHCPWINNCVGFYNRKFFLLFIFYLLLCLFTALVQMIIIEINQIKDIADNNRSTDIHTALRIIEILFCTLLFVTLSMFFYMHIGMVFSNTTTLQVMVRQRKMKNTQNQLFSDEKIQENPYDVDCCYNFTQVFGENVFCWFIPLNQDHLKGKGIFWQKRNLTKDISHNSIQQTVQLNTREKQNNY